MHRPDASIHAQLALLPGGWASDVAIDIDGQGQISSVRPGARPDGREIVAGPLLPAMPNLHSHAFQRAMAGLAERGGRDDSFWTWRDIMYAALSGLSPEDVEAIATKLYVDMLKAGYGAVAEFHYLHNDVDGLRYGDRAEMSRRILSAARGSGIGLTLLPVFYAHADFGGSAPSAGQSRFVLGTDDFLELLADLAPACAAEGATLGYAFHSLRAATPGEMGAILAQAPAEGPLHIHVAEQRREVEDCLAWSGRRPLDWLLDEMPVTPRWCLIHATHATADEVSRVARSGAVVGLCPTTEANLGDGVFPGTGFQDAGGSFGIGSDSHVSLSVVEELRWYEYGQRLRDQRRIRLSGGPGRSTGQALYGAALAGGARALGQRIGAIAPGHVASFVVLDGDNPLIGSSTADVILDRWIFAEGDRAVRDVMVAGTWHIRDRRHARDEEIDRAFAGAIGRLARS